MKAILFDLDGTLLPMDVDMFMKVYFYEMSKVFSEVCDIKTLSERIMKATEVMVRDTSDKTNKEVFTEAYSAIVNEDIDVHWALWDEYYENGYKNVKVSTKVSEAMIEAFKTIKEKGYKVILATNPLFPLYAIEQRIEWAGLDPNDFDYITSMEQNSYCKPQPKYYKQILEHNALLPEECMMVGNDVQEDMMAGKLGLKTYLVEDCMLHRTDEEVITTYRGSMNDFLAFAKTL